MTVTVARRVWQIQQRHSYLVERPYSGKAQRRFWRATEQLEHRDGRCQFLGCRLLHIHYSMCRFIDHHLTLVSQTTLQELIQWTVSPAANKTVTSQPSTNQTTINQPVQNWYFPPLQITVGELRVIFMNFWEASVQHANQLSIPLTALLISTPAKLYVIQSWIPFPNISHFMHSFTTY